MRFISLLCVFLVSQAFAADKPKTICRIDSCANAATYYQALNDSIYFVKAFFNGQVIFTGQIYRPDTNLLYDPSYLQNEYRKYILHGYCQFYALNGKPTEKAYYNFGSKKDYTLFFNGLIQTKGTLTPKKQIQEFYKNGHLHSKNIFKGETIKSVYYGGPRPYRSSNQYYLFSPFIKKYAPLNANGFIARKDVYFRFSKKIRHSYNYGDSGRLISVNTKDKNGVQINYQSFTSSGNNDSLFSESNTSYKFGKNKRIIQYKSIENQIGYSQNIHEFTFDTIQHIIYYRANEENYTIKHHSNFISIHENNHSKYAEYDEVDYLHKDSSIEIKCYKNKSLKFTRTFFKTEAPIPLKNFLRFKPEKWIHSLLPFDYIGDYNFYCNRYPNSEYYYSNDEKTDFLYIDSSYSNNKLETVYINAYDSIVRYNYVNNIAVLNYNSKAFRVAKDLQQCGTGLKNLKQDWVIPPQYDQVQIFLYDTNSLYICTKGEYTSIFNWKGELLFPSIKGIGIPYERNSYWDDRIIHLPDSFTKKQNLKSNVTIKIINKDENKYELRSINNTLIKKFNCPFSTFNIGDGVLLFRLTDSLGKQGICDLDRIIVPQIYSYVESLGDYHFIAHHFSDSISIFNPEGKICHSFKNVEIMRLYDRVLMVIDQFKHPRLFNYYTCQYLETTKDYEIVSKYDYWYSIKKGNKYGRVDFTLKTLIPPIYSSINNYYGHWICKNKDTFDIYKTDGQLISTLVCDSFYTNKSRSKSYAYDNDATVFKKDNKFGLINAFGKIILPAEFTDIAYAYLYESHEIYIGFKNDSLYFYKSDENHQLKTFFPFPFNSYVFYNSLCFYENHNGLLNANGKIIIEDIEHFSNNANIYSLTPINKNGKFIGSINRLGQWRFKSNDYQLAEENNNGQFLVLDNNRRAGLVSCSGRTIVKPEYQYISHNSKYNLLWFNCIHISSLENDPNTYNGIWKIKNLNTNEILTDTLYYPQTFEEGFLICQNTYKHWGIIDSTAKVCVPLKYKSYSFLLNGQYAFFLNDSVLDIFNKNALKLKSLKLKKIKLFNHNSYIGFNKSTSYILDSNFNFIDSSKVFFTNHKTLYKKLDYNNEQLSLLSDISTHISPKFDEAYGYNNFDVVKEFNFPFAILNFIKTISEYNAPNIKENIYGNAYVFPSPKYNDYNSYYQPYNKYDYDFRINYNSIGDISIFSDNINKHIYTPRKFNFSDIDDKIFYLQNYSNHTLSIGFQWNYPHQDEDLDYLNIYFDSLLGPLKFNLYDLVEDKKGFSDHVYASLKKLDNPLIPCFPNSDYLEKFSNTFMIEKEKLILLIDSNYKIELEIKNVLPYFDSFWQSRFRQ